MNKPNFPSRTGVRVLLTGIGLVTTPVFAADMGGVAIHGALSATAAYSDTYNYYGDTSESLEVIQKEITLNGAYRFENGVRANVQIYAYELADYSTLTLDFASLDYSVRPEFGVRAGRNKSTSSLYTDVQDLDQVRVFASLPLPFYPRALRSFGASFDGVSVYGTVSAGRAGSFDYVGSFGYLADLDKDLPFSRGVANVSLPQELDLGERYLASLTWNLPVDGLKVQAGFFHHPEIEIVGRLDTSAALVNRGFGSVAGGIDAAFGAGTWDRSGRFAGTRTSTEVEVTQVSLGTEYLRGKWTFSSEWKSIENEGTTTIPALGRIKSPVSTQTDDFYVQAVYQATDRLGLGVYYANSDTDPDDKDPAPSITTTLKDAAAAISFGITPWWLIKAEYHHLNGLGGLGVAGDVNPSLQDSTWNYIVFKTTLSF